MFPSRSLRLCARAYSDYCNSLTERSVRVAPVVNPPLPGKIDDLLFGFGCPFRFPVARLRFAVALELEFAFDGITAEFAVVFLDHLVPAEFACHGEGDLVPFQFAIFNRSFPCLSSLTPWRRECSGEFVVALELQFESALSVRAAISPGHAPGPSAGWIHLFVLGLDLGDDAERENRAGNEFSDG